LVELAEVVDVVLILFGDYDVISVYLAHDDFNIILNIFNFDFNKIKKCLPCPYIDKRWRPYLNY